jgi:hypothetical protein
MVDVSTVPLTEIVNRELNLDHQNLGLGLSPFRSIAPSLKAEEKAFRQAVQCTVCLQFGHSNVECVQRCALCQARTHTTATCEYNLLAQRNALAVQTVQPVPVQNRGQRDNHRFNNGNLGGRQFQCGRGRPQFQNQSFRQEGADPRQVVGPSRSQGNRRWDQRRPGRTPCVTVAVNPHPPPGQASNKSTSQGPMVKRQQVRALR